MESKIQKYTHLAKKRWYIQGFNCTPNLIYFGMTSGIVGNNKKVGYGYSAMIHVFKNDYNDYHYDVEDLKIIGRNILNNFRKNNNYIRDLISKDKKDFEEIFNFYSYLNKIKLDKIESKKLIELYQKTSQYYSQLIDRSHIIEGFGLTYDVDMKNRIEQYMKEKNIDRKPNEVFTILTTPEKSSFMVEEGRELLKIILEITKNNELFEIFKNNDTLQIELKFKKFKAVYSKLEEHQKKYYWIQNSYAGAKILQINDFIAEIKKMIKKGVNPEQAVKEQNLKLKLIIKDKKYFLEKLQLPKDLVEMIVLSNELTLWQDERKKSILITIHYLDRLLLEIGKRYNIKKEFVRYLLPFEVTESNLQKVDNKTLKQRKEGCIIISKGNAKGMNTEIFIGKDYKKYLELLHKPRIEEIKELSGMCASQGKAVGKVRVCKSLKDIHEFKEGEILVTAMTRPEFVPAIKKAAAIVTDEGGITCHAAIVSRELNIPCVIGTKTATKMLNNGNLVEVRANHGIVVILEK